MDLATYLSTAIAICGLAIGAMYMIVSLQGKRFDDISGRFDDINGRFDDINGRFDDVGRRFDDVNLCFDDVNRRFDGVDRRMDRLEAQNESIIGAVSDLGHRVTRLETRDAT